MKRLAILLVLASVLSGCPGKNKTRSKDTLYLQLHSEPKSLDAFSSRQDGYASDINDQIFDTMLDTDIDSFDYVPSLAKEYFISKDGKVFTFKIREGVKFTDGRPLTTEDIKFSFDAIFDDKYGAITSRPYYENIEKAEVVDAHTIKFYAKKKYFQNLGFIGGLRIVPKHLYEVPSKKNHTMSIGSGPWMIDSYKQGRSITLKRNEDWWGKNVEYYKGHHKTKKKHYSFIKDEKVIFESFKKGNLDFVGLTSEQYIKKTEGKPWGQTVFKEVVSNNAPKSMPFVGWNLKNPLFKNRDVRRALTHLYDRDMLVKKFLYDQAVPAAGPWYSKNPAADPNKKPLPFDPKLAKDLLKKAGWADEDKNGVLENTIDGKKVEFKFTLLNPNPDYEKYFTVYREELKRAGISMNITNLEWNAFQRKMDDHDFDALFLVWSGTVRVDPKQVWHSTSAVRGGSNFISYKNSKVDKLIDKGRLELDRDKRHAIFRQVFTIISDDAPYVFLYNKKSSFYGYNQRMVRPKPFFNYSVGINRWSIKAD